ncbi:MAG: nitroreductase family deazaflavin-dependent oxidoreductase [Chloroflexi bacterium]|nr:nitroreductase family deazaflavin-dependent oxidoreductase [Chloroflexota bacterium]
MSDWNAKIIEEFRENEGVVGGQFASMPLLLLHTTGAKSGQERVNPLAYLEEGDQLAVMASKGGAPTHPDWYYNVVANAGVSVEIGTEEYKAVAQIADEPERTEIYGKMIAKNPGFAKYLETTTRVIPVILLSREE